MATYNQMSAGYVISSVPETPPKESGMGLAHAAHGGQPWSAKDIAAFQGRPLSGIASFQAMNAMNGMHSMNGMMAVNPGMPNGVPNGVPTGMHNGMPTGMQTPTGILSPQSTSSSQWNWSPVSSGASHKYFEPGSLDYGSSLQTMGRVEGSTDLSDARSAPDTDFEDDYDDDIQFLGQRTTQQAQTQPQVGSASTLSSSFGRSTQAGRVTKSGLAIQSTTPRRSARAAQALKQHVDVIANTRLPHIMDEDDDPLFAFYNLLPPVISKPDDIALQRIYDQTPPEGAVDDDEGYYVVQKGALFANRYMIVRLLGQGTFGKVVEAVDVNTQRRVAIKIIRAIPKYRDASRIELRILSLLGHYDPNNNARCVRMQECFDYRNHVCLVTELLDISVYDFLKENDFLPFPGHHIVMFARQLLRSLAFIHSLGLVHTDLKPENILLSCSDCVTDTYKRGRSAQKPRRVLKDTRISLIDFGSAIFDDEYHSTVVSTRHYRAPEIILGTGWSFPCDIWSVGCVLVELCTGGVLFQTRDNLVHLSMMEKTLETRFGPSVIAKAATKAAGCALVDVHSKSLRPVTDRKQLASVSKLQPLAWQVRSAVPYNRDRQFWDNFLDFVHKMLALDPNDRPTAREALDHPWLRG